MSVQLDRAIKECGPNNIGSETKDTRALYAIALGIQELLVLFERLELVARKDSKP